MIHTFTSKLKKKEKISKDVYMFSFTKPEDFTFKAGQFIALKISDGEETKSRSYSIFNPPSDNTLKLCIKIVEDGFASKVFKNMQEGEELEVKGPFGHFTFNENSEKDAVFICSGTGLAPLYSMIKEYLANGKKFHLIFSNKTRDDLILHDELLELEKDNENFMYTSTLTREEWGGKTGRVQKHLPENLDDKIFYICGLKELVMETKEILINKGVSSDNIKFERYS